jgi:hypothetical protein
VKLPLEATVDQVIAKCFRDALRLEDDDNIQPSKDLGCVGFLATARDREDFGHYDYYNDYDEVELDAIENPTGLASKLTANGGVLLKPGKTLSSYGLDAKSCFEVTLYPVFADAEKQPRVFKADLKKFGEEVYKYVRLQEEDKEIVQARQHFGPSMLPWLAHLSASGGGCRGQHIHGGQSLTLSMEDSFPEDAKPILTLHLVPTGEELSVIATSLAGDSVCSVNFAADDTIAKLRSTLSQKLLWPSMTLWDGAEVVPEASYLSKHSVLTAEKINVPEHICGCYQHHDMGVGPAGYSASGESMTNTLILEPGRAGLLYCFKGDYKRAEKLVHLEMKDARWSVESSGEGTDVVRIVGKAVLNRFYCHERSGSDGCSLSNYSCFALVKVPLEQLAKSQETEDYHSHSTPGSGWSCGSESFRYSYFLPMCLVDVLRTKPEGESDSLLLRKLLNSNASPDFPYSQIIGGSRRYGRHSVTRISAEEMEMIKHFRQRLVGRAHVAIAELLELQKTVPAPADREAKADEADEM